MLKGEPLTEKKYRDLTKEEERVIVNKGTEPPYSGKYNNFYEDGFYYCKRCNSKLYSSKDKFKSNCGWPSFDDEVKGAILRKIDRDGVRTEILCANCEAHLGHVFNGEGFTSKNIRHCVNSISMVFKGKEDENTLKTAYFAGGCFWGVEYYFEKQEGVISAESGYMGGNFENPSYEDVCSGETGHLESVKVTYDSNRVNFETLARLFFEIHDPTHKFGQGPDIGSQYLSAIFYNGDDELEISKKLISLLKDKGFDVVTKILPVSKFYIAENYHQNYYKRVGKTPYCHGYTKRF